MEAFSHQQERETKALNMKRRRLKLSRLLEDERAQHHAELSGLSKDNLTRLAEMKERSEELKSAREEKRKEQAADLLYQQWKKNDPKLRQLEQEMHNHHVIGKWGEQKGEKEEALESARREDERYQNEYEKERIRALERMRQREQERLEEERRLKAVLKQQIEELRSQETEGASLRLEQDALMREKWQLEQLDEQRKLEQQRRKQRELGRVLLRQHAASLKRKSKQVQEDLERDRKLLEDLASKEAEEKTQLTSRREKAKADAQWMKQVIEDQLKVERTREAELDMLYADEAAREWEKRAAQWTREEAARARLMQEVMDGRQDQIQQRMSVIREEQDQSLRRREELLAEMEAANQLTRRDQARQERQKTERKDELEAQITSRRETRREEGELVRLELEEDGQAQRDYEEMLQQETERMALAGYQDKLHSRRAPPKNAWL